MDNNDAMNQALRAGRGLTADESGEEGESKSADAHFGKSDAGAGGERREGPDDMNDVLRLAAGKSPY